MSHNFIVSPICTNIFLNKLNSLFILNKILLKIIIIIILKNKMLISLYF